MPLEDRMARFAELREVGAFLPASFDNPMTRADRGVLGHDALRGARRDQPPARGLLLGTRGGVDPRPAGGGIGVLRVVHQHGRPAPRVASAASSRARSRRDSSRRCSIRSRRSAAEVIDGMCERGEVDLVEALSQPFPLLVICDMMGIPRSEFRHGARRDERHPRRRRPRHARRARPDDGDVRSGHAAHDADERARRGAPQEPARRPHLRARERARRRGHPGAARDRAVLHPARGRGQRHDPHRDQSRHAPAGAEPRSTSACGRTISTA